MLSLYLLVCMSVHLIAVFLFIMIVFLFYRGYYNHTRRCPLGGCMVAGVLDSRPHHTAVCCASVVHAQVSPCIRGSTVQVLC